MPILRFIGDVHQRYESYLPLVQDVDYSVQVGDLGFDYAYLQRVGLDPARHRAIAGNHDNYDEAGENYFKRQPVFLGDFGLHRIPGFPDIFFVRGAWSIDHLQRKRRQGWPYNQKGTVSWWETEELSHDDLVAANDLYLEARPEVVVSHEAPLSLVRHITDPAFARAYGYEDVIQTRTSLALQAMFDLHQPKSWYFGHYHRSWEQTISGTTFTCLDMIRGARERDLALATRDVAF